MAGIGHGAIRVAQAGPQHAKSYGCHGGSAGASQRDWPRAQSHAARAAAHAATKWLGHGEGRISPVRCRSPSQSSRACRAPASPANVRTLDRRIAKAEGRPGMDLDHPHPVQRREHPRQREPPQSEVHHAGRDRRHHRPGMHPATNDSPPQFRIPDPLASSRLIGQRSVQSDYDRVFEGQGACPVQQRTVTAVALPVDEP